MARTRRARPDLTESWDDVDDSDEGPDSQIWGEDTEREEVGSAYRDTRKTRQRRDDEGSRLDAQDDRYENPRRRALRSSVEPELVMPSSPDGATTARRRDATPRLRLNERSNTSDAGALRKQTRAATPRMRMADRSMTSDAGRLRGSRLVEHDEAEYESEEEKTLLAKAPAAIWQRVVQPLLAYALDVAGYTLNHLKPVLGYALLAYLLAAAMIFGSGFLTNSINNALSPICRLPFTGGFAFCPSKNAPELQGAAEFDKLIKAQDAFQDVLASTAVGANLPLDMKRSEASIRDLKHVVQYSSLPSRNELVFEFGGFVDTARQASQDLGRFNSRIGRAVDHILSTNRWTLSVIDGVTAKDAQRGTLSKWISSKANVFAPFQPLSLSRDVLLDQYLRHTSAVEEQILSLINEAYALRDILDNLDGRLDVISGIVTRDGIKVDAAKDELFSTLWTKLGGNRGTVKKLDQQLGLLDNVGLYRRQAWGHVTATLVKLQAIQHSLEDLRERVALPETVGTDKVPLEVHIENINLGIERLENQRDLNRQVESERYARIIGKADQDEQQRKIGD